MKKVLSIVTFFLLVKIIKYYLDSTKPDSIEMNCYITEDEYYEKVEHYRPEFLKKRA